jgi:hypothetical protein
VTVKSELGRGTTIMTTCRELSRVQTKRPSNQRQMPPALNSVLVVEDNPRLWRCSSMLEQVGYQVRTVTSAQPRLRLLPSKILILW